jgi:hypothetical protein
MLQPLRNKPDDHRIGLGATEELNLRVSVATLVRLLFIDPDDGQLMLALERTATMQIAGGNSEVIVRAKPFGGGVRLTDPKLLQKTIGLYHYDSRRSSQEQDFRLQINPASWKTVKKICRNQFKTNKMDLFDFNPDRELAEEFEDCLNIRINRGQYNLKPGKLVIHDKPVRTESVRAPGHLTVRIFAVYEARIQDPDIIRMMLVSSRRYTDRDLQMMALDNARYGGRGRANAVLALPLEAVIKAYRSGLDSESGDAKHIEEHLLENNVGVILQ